MPRTALIIEVPEAEPAVHDLRLAHDWSAARGVPAHITILFPFADSSDVDEAALEQLFARFRPFDFVLDRVERFDTGTTWLHPEPPAPFEDLTAAVAQRWPEHPPYEGIHDVVIPHLTVSDTYVELDIDLPIASHAQAVTLIEENAAGDRWAARRTFSLG